jgi:tetrahydromethanopterin S-methyltransferase subunit A
MMAEQGEIGAEESMEVPVDDFNTFLEEEPAEEEKDEEEKDEEKGATAAVEPEQVVAEKRLQSTDNTTEVDANRRQTFAVGCLFLAGAAIVGAVLGTLL